VTIQHKFVDLIPSEKVFGVLYISLEYGIISHLCPCGCGNLIVTPLAPWAWSLTFNGETVSLNHSIGNWELPCKSHYWIRNGQIRWAGRFDEKKIIWVRDKDERDHVNQFKKKGSKKSRE
jgi:hypothetical protein